MSDALNQEIAAELEVLRVKYRGVLDAPDYWLDQKPPALNVVRVDFTRGRRDAVEGDL